MQSQRYIRVLNQQPNTLTDQTIIPSCPTLYPGLIATGSTKRSMAKFWAAVGVLEKAGENFNELVLTPKQLDAAQFDWKEVKLEGLKGKNFSKIRVLRAISLGKHAGNINQDING